MVVVGLLLVVFALFSPRRRHYRDRTSNLATNARRVESSPDCSWTAQRESYSSMASRRAPASLLPLRVAHWVRRSCSRFESVTLTLSAIAEDTLPPVSGDNAP